MANVRYRLWGLSGSRKTCTALTGRGNQAVIDRDNQMWMYWANPRFEGIFSPFAIMAEDFSGLGPDGAPLAKGSKAVWLAMDPAETTRDRVREFTRKAGLGKGDQLVDDPFAGLWEMSVDAADVKFGQKGMKIDYYGMKQPTTTLMNLYKAAAYDVAFTAHQKAEWSKTANQPTDKVIPTGETQRTPRDIMWEFRMEMVDSGDCHMTVTKEKGMLFRVGERFVNPVIRELFAARGLYQFADGLAEQPPVEMDEARAEALLGQADSPELATLLQFELDAREAAKAGRLAEFRADEANRRRVGAMAKSGQEAVRRLMTELAGK